MTDIVFSIAHDFSVNPGPRRKSHGSHSGESLRPKLARILRESAGRIQILLDGTRGMGSSFLDEAFGGLVRYEGFKKNEILDRFEFVSRTDPSYIDTIIDSLERAEKERA